MASITPLSGWRLTNAFVRTTTTQLLSQSGIELETLDAAPLSSIPTKPGKRDQCKARLCPDGNFDIKSLSVIGRFHVVLIGNSSASWVGPHWWKKPMVVLRQSIS